MSEQMPEDVYQGELVGYPGAWDFHIPRAHIILVRDQDLIDFCDPDKVVNLSMDMNQRSESLRHICENAQRIGARTLVLAFDQFFSQYRPGQGDTPRQLMPDHDEYIERLGKISAFIKQYGLALELSLLSPLEIGPSYREQTGQHGTWLHYRKGLRDPKTGQFSVQFWKQTLWVCNKGPVALEDRGVRVFAFQEIPLPGMKFHYVPPESIVEITDIAQSEDWAGFDLTTKAVRKRVFGEGHTELQEQNRVLVVQQYDTPEMDYFSPQSLPYLTDLIDRYADAGVKLNALYADEMHIQQDWAYHSHHDNGEYAVRYVTDNMVAEFARRYGDEYRDFAKYLVYFTFGQEDCAHDISAKMGISHVMAPDQAGIARTMLLRSRYYRLLHDQVVDLFATAKEHAEKRMGRMLQARAHPTWAESPTCDMVLSGGQNAHQMRYEYTSAYYWSNTIHQAAAACDDFFKWGDFLTGNGNDHAEGGWSDRNYFGRALACSTGIVNRVSNSYAAMWGAPHEVVHYHANINNTYGAASWLPYGMVQNLEHRDVEVLMLYPLDLISAEDTFGSWMTQYGYANYITQQMLVERGEVRDGAIELAGRSFPCLVALYEPLPSPKLISMMEQLVASGGSVVWSGPPPLLDRDGTTVRSRWEKLFLVETDNPLDHGYPIPGQRVQFEGELSDVPEMMVLTDFLVDRVYPIINSGTSEIIARTKDYIVGAMNRFANGGQVVYLGFRPRDDQSASLGYETRTWFEILDQLGAYPATGTFEDCNDNPQHLSRTTPYLCTCFPNGAIAMSPHFRTYEENWPGDWARDRQWDQTFVAENPLPTQTMKLEDFRVNGHTITYSGGPFTFRLDQQGDLVALAGRECCSMTVDNKQWDICDDGVHLVSFAPVEDAALKPDGALLRIMAYGSGEVRIPWKNNQQQFVLVAEGSKPGSRGEVITHTCDANTLRFGLDEASQGRWLYLVPAGD